MNTYTLGSVEWFGCVGLTLNSVGRSLILTIELDTVSDWIQDSAAKNKTSEVRRLVYEMLHTVNYFIQVISLKYIDKFHFKK